MKRAVRWAVNCLAAVLALACDGVTAPEGLPVDIVVSPLTAPPVPASGTVAGGTVVLLGALGTPDPCYTFAARATPSGDTVDVRLEARSSAQGCIAIVGAWSYQVSVRDVPAGEWLVRLTLEIRGGAPSTRLFEGRLSIGSPP